MRPSSSSRRPEKWFNAGLWLVSFLFAWFLIGLGGELVEQLPERKELPTLESYTDKARYTPLKNELTELNEKLRKVEQNLALAQQNFNEKQDAAETEAANLRAWQGTRFATRDSEHNPEVIKRTQALENLNKKAQEAEQAVHALQSQQLKLSQQKSDVRLQMNELEEQAQELQAQDLKVSELEEFLYRLAITLPLLILAGYLFAKQRQSRWWPFVWGFIFFALFAFFVELIPYLPSYGGYVRYLVGIVLTVLVGRYAILALSRYLERKKTEEAQPITERQAQLSYDQAQLHLQKSTCPSCERLLDFQDPKMDFCPHCGINLFHACKQCHTRKSSFSRYCFSCGAKD